MSTTSSPLLAAGSHSNGSSQRSSGFSFIYSIFNPHGAQGSAAQKKPVNVEPKIYFANERTFVAWMNMAVTIATISLAVVAFGNNSKVSKVYGLFLLPISIAFVGYALFLFVQRAGMIRRRDPGPYDEWNGPIALAGIVALSIIALFCFNLATLLSR